MKSAVASISTSQVIKECRTSQPTRKQIASAMADKSNAVLHSDAESSSAHEHFPDSTHHCWRDKGKAQSPVDKLIEDFDSVMYNGSDSAKPVFSNLVDYEPDLINCSTLSDVTFTWEEISHDCGADKQSGDSSAGVDFITRLPRPALHEVLCRLDPVALAEASLVSNDWYKRISEFVTKWSHIELSDNDSRVHTAYENVISVSPYICSLSIQFLNTNEPMDALIQSLTQLRFQNLRLLDLGCMVTKSELIFKLLTRVKDTLSHLTLMCVADDGIDLTAILSQCTNLTHLRYCAPDLKNIEIDSASCISGTSKLISLQLITSSISFDNFASRLRYATQIQMLVLCECEPDVMDALNQYAGPDLEYLHINPNLDCIFPPFVDVEYTVRGGGGLSTVIANKMDTHALDKLIAMLVNRAQSSLQHLHITTIPAAHAAFPGINSVHFGALRTLFWGGITPSLGFAVAVVIRESPCLEELTLQDCEVVDAEMLSALSGLKRLEKLAIIRATDIDHTHLARFFLAHGELMHASPLNEFELVGCSSVLVPDTLSALSTVLTLRRLGLGIQGKDQRVSVAEMDQFLTRLSKNACALESVTLTSLNIVTDTGLLKLGEAEGLIEVVLTNLPRITNQGVHRFVDACSSLRSVRIEQCPLVLDNALADLEKKLLQRAMKYM